MNIYSYLNQRGFEDFVDQPIGTEPAPHGDAPAAEPVPTSIEIPETAGPVVIASADEVQAATVVEDPAHTEAEAAANAVSDADTNLLENAETTPGAEPATPEVTDVTETDAGGATDAPVETELGTDSTPTGDELGGGDAPVGDTGPITESADTPVETSEADTGTEAPIVDEPAADADPEDGLSGEVPEVEETEDGLGSEIDSGGETGETEANTDDQEAGGETTEEESESEETEESESEAEVEGEEQEESEDEDGVDYDIPDVDTEIEDEEIEDAEDEAAEAVAEEEELDEEIVDTSKSVAELDEEDVAVEHYISVLSHGIQTKRFNPQTVALAQAKLQSLSNTFGAESPVIPSMEDYTAQNLGAYYTNSLESFSDFLKKIRHARKNFFDNFAQKMNDKIHLKAVEKEIDSLNKQLDKQIVRVKDLDLDGPVELSIPNPARRKDGVIKGATAELAWLNDVASVFKLDHAYLNDIAKVLKQAVGEGDAVKATDLANKALKVSMPGKKYPASAFSGNPVVDMKFVKSGVTATGSLAEDMKSLAARAIPDIEGSQTSTVEGLKKETFKKADLVKILQICKIMIGLSRGTSGSAGKQLVEQLDVANRTSSEKDLAGGKAGDKEAQRKGEAALSQLVNQFWAGISRSLENYSQFQWRIVAVVDALLRLVMRAK